MDNDARRFVLLSTDGGRPCRYCNTRAIWRVYDAGDDPASVHTCRRHKLTPFT